MGRLLRWTGGIALGVGVVGFVGHEAISADDPSPASLTAPASGTDGDDERPTEAAWETVRIKGFRFDLPTTATVDSDPDMGLWNRNWYYDAPPETAIALSMSRSSIPVTEADLRQVMLTAVPSATDEDIRIVEGPGTVNLAHRYRTDGHLNNALLMSDGQWVVVVLDVSIDDDASPEFARIVESFRFPG